MAGSPAKLHSFCHLCMTPSPHHHDHPHVEYSRCLEMRMNMDYSANRSGYDSPEGYPNSPFPGSPQSRSSCMYSLHGNSPSIVHPLSLRSSAERYMSPTKENGLYRDIPPHCRRRLDFNHNDFIGLSKAIPVTVAKRNERERNRVKLINTTFQTLRQHLPVQSRGAKGQAKKLSKVQTLRSAIEYIRKLEDLIEDRTGTTSKIKNEKVSSSTEIKQEIYKDDDDDLDIEEGMDDADSNIDTLEAPFSKDAKRYPTINNNIPTNNSNNNNDRITSAHESHYYEHNNNNNYPLNLENNDIEQEPNNNNNNINNNNNTHREQQHHYQQHHRGYYHHHNHYQKSHYQDGRGPHEGVGYKYNNSGHRFVKCHSEEGSASPVDSDVSGDVMAAEEEEFFDFDLWFWTD